MSNAHPLDDFIKMQILARQSENIILHLLLFQYLHQTNARTLKKSL